MFKYHSQYPSGISTHGDEINIGRMTLVEHFALSTLVTEILTLFEISHRCQTCSEMSSYVSVVHERNLRSPGHGFRESGETRSDLFVLMT